MEPKITINGVPLTQAQAMTLRCALENFMLDLHENGLGEDPHGKLMTEAFQARGQEIRKLIFKRG